MAWLLLFRLIPCPTRSLPCPPHTQFLHCLKVSALCLLSRPSRAPSARWGSSKAPPALCPAPPPSGSALGERRIPTQLILWGAETITARYSVQKQRLEGWTASSLVGPALSEQGEEKTRGRGTAARPGQGLGSALHSHGAVLWGSAAHLTPSTQIHIGEGQVWSHEGSPDANEKPRGSVRAPRGATQPAGWRQLGAGDEPQRSRGMTQGPPAAPQAVASAPGVFLQRCRSAGTQRGKGASSCLQRVVAQRS